MDWWKITRWFNYYWYSYLFAKKSVTAKSWGISWITIILCRMKNHPGGVWWYTSSRLEPDMRCKNCGDDLG